MHPRFLEVLNALDASQAELQRAVSEIPADSRSRRPSPERWSVAEVVDHLAIVEEGIARLIRQRVADARANGLGLEHDASPVAQTFDSRPVLDRTRPRVARDTAQPRTGIDETSAATRLESVRRATREALLDADGLALSDVVAPHPVFGALNVYQWLLFVAAHQARHAAQVREIHAAVIG